MNSNLPEADFWPGNFRIARLTMRNPTTQGVGDYPSTSITSLQCLVPGHAWSGLRRREPREAWAGLIFEQPIPYSEAERAGRVQSAGRAVPTCIFVVQNESSFRA